VGADKYQKFGGGEFSETALFADYRMLFSKEE